MVNRLCQKVSKRLRIFAQQESQLHEALQVPKGDKHLKKEILDFHEYLIDIRLDGLLKYGTSTETEIYNSKLARYTGELLDGVATGEGIWESKGYNTVRGTFRHNKMNGLSKYLDIMLILILVLLVHQDEKEGKMYIYENIQNNATGIATRYG